MSAGTRQARAGGIHGESQRPADNASTGHHGTVEATAEVGSGTTVHAATAQPSLTVRRTGTGSAPFRSLVFQSVICGCAKSLRGKRDKVPGCSVAKHTALELGGFASLCRTRTRSEVRYSLVVIPGDFRSRRWQDDLPVLAAQSFDTACVLVQDGRRRKPALWTSGSVEPEFVKLVSGRKQTVQTPGKANR